MRIGVMRQLSLGLMAALCAAAGLAAQTPPSTSIRVGGGAAPGASQPPAPQQPAPATPAVRPPVARPVVDQAAHDRGRAVWAIECVTCHGAQARGADDGGPNIIRTRTVNFDRLDEKPGSVLGPFLRKGHPTQSKKPSASFTDAEIVDLANFLRQRVNDTMRGSPLFTVGDIVVGDKVAGEAYFKGAGGCAACHTAAERSLAGVATRIPQPVDLQQRLLFPGGGGGRRGGRPRGGPPGAGAPAGAAPAAAPAPDRNAITVSITSPNGPAVSGVLVEESDFFVTIRNADGAQRTIRRTPGMKVTKNNPLQAHIDLLDRITDSQIHDVVAYLETMK